MTPKHPILTMPSGKRFEVVKFGKPQPGQQFLGYIDGGRPHVFGYGPRGERPILKPIPSPEPSEGGIQRRGDLPCVTIGDEKLWALVETACAVVNKNTHNGRILECQYDHAELKDLAAALASFTEPTPQPERYYVGPGRLRVYDRQKQEPDDDYIAQFESAQDAKDFADLKNQSEADDIWENR